MELINTTSLSSGYSLGLLKSGRSCLVVVAKGTFEIPKGMTLTEAKLLREQTRPYEEEKFSGEPGMSSPLYEMDYAPLKPKCDVIVHCSAYTSDTSTFAITGVKIGDFKKVIRVIGKRVWIKANEGLIPSDPVPFIKQEINYEVAYGGTDNTKEEQGESKTFMQNPIGLGYWPDAKEDDVVNKPLPLTETPNQEVTHYNQDNIAPQSYGPIARNWLPRYKLSGTYDENWIKNIRPFLPEDFNESFYQCAPADQQIDYPRGGEIVMLVGLTPEIKTQFKLPVVSIPMKVVMKSGHNSSLSPVIDTITIEPDKRRLTMVWRARVGLRQSIHEINSVIIGNLTPGMERADLVDKPYISMSDLNEFARQFIQHEQAAQALRDQNTIDE